MTVYSNDGLKGSNDEKLANFHNTRNCPKEVVCIKDDPPMVGFGRKLKKGDVVTINGTVHHEIGFSVSVPDECAFYAYDAFDYGEGFFNK